MDDEGGDGSAQLAAGLHDAETKGNYFGCEQEVDDFTVVHLYKSTDDTERGQAQVFKGPSFADCVEKRVEEQRDVRLEEAGASVRVAGHALQQSQRIAHSIRGLCLKHGRVQHWVYACYLLEQNGNGSKAVPKNGRKVGEGLTLLAEFEKSGFAGFNAVKLLDELKQSFSILN